jgi:hypothetical protein
MQTVRFQKSEIPLYAKFKIKKGILSAAYSIALFERNGQDMILNHKGKNNFPVSEGIVELPSPVSSNHERFVRCITDFKSMDPARNNIYQISLEIYQGNSLLGTVEQEGELSYNQKCLMFFSKLVEI